MKLFHISALVPSAFLYEAMRRLEDCRAYNVEVKTASVKSEAAPKSKFRGKNRYSGQKEKMYYVVAQALPEQGAFNRTIIREAIVKVGGNASSIGSCTDSMLRAKLIKKVGRDQYRRLAAKAAEEAA